MNSGPVHQYYDGFKSVCKLLNVPKWDSGEFGEKNDKLLNSVTNGLCHQLRFATHESRCITTYNYYSTQITICVFIKRQHNRVHNDGGHKKVYNDDTEYRLIVHWYISPCCSGVIISSNLVFFRLNCPWKSHDRLRYITVVEEVVNEWSKYWLPT